MSEMSDENEKLFENNLDSEIQENDKKNTNSTVNDCNERNIDLDIEKDEPVSDKPKKKGRGRAKKPMSDERREQLLRNLALGREKSKATRAKKKELNRLKKENEKKFSIQEENLLKELQEKKKKTRSNDELLDEIQTLKNKLNEKEKQKPVEAPAPTPAPTPTPAPSPVKEKPKAKPPQKPESKPPPQPVQTPPQPKAINYEAYRGTGMSNRQIENMLKFMGM